MANNEKSQNTLVHDTICLFLITLIAGILLGGVYMITKKPIDKQNEKTKQEHMLQFTVAQSLLLIRTLIQKLRIFRRI